MEHRTTVGIGLALVPVALVLVLGARPSSSQTPPVPSFPSAVGVVRIDVVVLDKKGRAVTDLHASDFEIREDGKTQEIVTFEPIVVRERQVAAEQARAEDENAEPVAAFSPEEGRCLVVFFDDVHLSAVSAERVRAALVPLLERQLRPGDRIAVVAPLAGLDWTSGPPVELARLAQALRRLQGSYVVRHPFGSAAEWNAVRAVELGNGRNVRDQEIYRMVQERQHLTLSALERALASLERFRGRKAILLLSEGFVRIPGLSGYDEAVAVARRANAAVYFIDPRGLETGLPGPGSSGTGIGLSPAIRQDMEGAAASYLAAATGGRTSFSNDVAAPAREALEELSAYYLVGYQPPEGKPGERKLKVRVKRPGLEARYRTRYFVFGEPATD